MARNQSEIEEIRKLYEDEKLSLQAIASRFGLTKQGIHYRLKSSGVQFRKRGGSTVDPSDVERLTQMYVDEKKTGKEIGLEIGVSATTVFKRLARYGIDRRRPADWKRKHPELAGLEVGESLIVPRPKRRTKYQHYYYFMGKSLGIRISVKTLDDSHVRLTRVK